MAETLGEDMSEEEKEALLSGLSKLNQFFADTIEKSNEKHK